MLTQLIYASRARWHTSDHEGQTARLGEILAASRRHNQGHDITGFLVADGTWYLQIIEGERRQVITTYGRVQTDPRHGDISLMALHDVAVRSFPHWSMGGVMRAPIQQPVFARHGIGDKLDPSRLMAPAILALCLDLQDFELSTQPAFRLAG